jgi:hypothetical protein
MGRAKIEGQLGLRWLEEMQWEDLPTPIRERVRESLAALLREAAVRVDRGGEEVGDE